MLLTLSACPRMVKRHRRLFRSHNLQVLSIEQDATKSPQVCQVQPQTETHIYAYIQSCKCKMKENCRKIWEEIERETEPDRERGEKKRETGGSYTARIKSYQM